ncbi:MAG: type II toxin-antitoxin system VapC family toxin [Pseudomonadota bacterium]
MFILDTNVVSALRRPERAPQVLEWAQRNRQSGVFISVITLGEIENGIARQERRDSAFADDLAQWRDVILGQYAGGLLPVKLEDALRWGRLSSIIGNNGPDIMIAAQALTRDWIVVTRNTSDFVPTGARVINPFEPT